MDEIIWDIVGRIGEVDAYSAEVMLKGITEAGKKYEAVGIMEEGEIIDIDYVEEKE